MALEFALAATVFYLKYPQIYSRSDFEGSMAQIDDAELVGLRKSVAISEAIILEGQRAKLLANEVQGTLLHDKNIKLAQACARQSLLEISNSEISKQILESICRVTSPLVGVVQFLGQAGGTMTILVAPRALQKEDGANVPAIKRVATDMVQAIFEHFDHRKMRRQRFAQNDQWYAETCI